LQKIEVTCRTCGVSDSFYSNLSVERFKARHRGHEIVMGGMEDMPPEAPYKEPAPSDEEPLERKTAARKAVEREGGTRIPRVIVDLVTFPALRDSVFRVRGFKDDLEEAFVATSRFEHSAKVREMLASGEYVDYDFSGLRFFWEPDAIQYEGDAREKLGLPAEVANDALTVEPKAEQSEGSPDIDDSTVAKTNEALFGEPHAEEAAPTGDERVFPPLSAPPAPAEELEAPAPRARRRPSRERPPKDEQAEPSAPLQPPPKPEEKIEEKKPLETTSVKAAAPPAGEDDYLLVSKSWYIQGGERNKKEAVRISKVLKAFRWKVEPVYTIGVILDDILSIETSRNQITRTLITRVESSGYRLTAVTDDQGKPVAWFRKVGDEAPNTLAEEGREETGAGAPAGPNLDDLDAELDADVNG